MDTNFNVESLKCLTSKVGEGTYGKVFSTNSTKHVCKVTQEESEGLSVSFLRECAAMKALTSSVHVLDITSIVATTGKQKMYLPKYQMDLKHFIDSSVYNDAVVRNISYQMLSGMLDAHKLSITHRDLKPQNILINNDLKIVLADWGLARFTETTDYKAFTGEVQTLWYRCPELLLGQKNYNISVDVWSLGVIICELINKSPLFPGDCEIGQLYKIFQVCGIPNTNDWPEVKDYPEYKEIFPKWKPIDLVNVLKTKDTQLLDLLSKMLNMNPLKRISLVDALNHPYFDAIREAPIHSFKLLNNLSSFNKNKISNNYFVNHNDLNPRMRKILFDWLIIMSHKAKLESQTLFLACAYCDLYLSNKTGFMRKNLQLLGLSCLLLATKITERYSGTYHEYINMCDGLFTKKQLMAMELDIIKTLDYNLFVCTEYTFLNQLKNEFNLTDDIYEKAICILYITLLDYSFRKYNPQDLAIVAASCYSIMTESLGQIMELIFLCHVSVEDWKNAKNDIDELLNNQSSTITKDVNIILEGRLRKIGTSKIPNINQPKFNDSLNSPIPSIQSSIFGKLRNNPKKYKITVKQLKSNKT